MIFKNILNENIYGIQFLLFIYFYLLYQEQELSEKQAQLDSCGVNLPVFSNVLETLDRHFQGFFLIIFSY